MICMIMVYNTTGRSLMQITSSARETERQAKQNYIFHQLTRDN